MSETRDLGLTDPETPNTNTENITSPKKKVFSRRDFLKRAGGATAGFALAAGAGFSESRKAEAQERKVRLPIFINTEKYDSDGGITHKQLEDFLNSSLENDSAVTIYTARDPRKVGVEVRFTCQHESEKESHPALPNAIRQAGGNAAETVIQNTANKASGAGELASILAQAAAQVARAEVREKVSTEITDGDQPITIILETTPAFYSSMKPEHRQTTEGKLAAIKNNEAKLNIVIKIKTSTGGVSGTKNVKAEAVTINGKTFKLQNGGEIGKNLRQDQILPELKHWITHEVFSDPTTNPVAQEAQVHLGKFVSNIKKAAHEFQNIPNPNTPKK